MAENNAPEPGKEWSSNPDTKRMEQRVVGLRQTNTDWINEVTSAGVGIDLSIPRIEHFIDWLRQNGAFTYDEQLEEEEQWQTSVREQLRPVVDQVREAVRHAQAARKLGVQPPTSKIEVSRGSGSQAMKDKG